VVGNFTVDHVDGAKRPGGPGYYSSIALALLGAKVYVLGYAGQDYPRDVLEEIRKLGVDLSLVSMDSPTTIFVLEYLDLQTRVLKLLSRSPKIKIEEGYRVLGNVEVSIVSPVAGEISLEDLGYIRKKTRILVVDVQGFIRVIESDGQVYHKWNHGLLDELGIVDIIHVEEGEANSISKEPILISFHNARLPTKIIPLSFNSSITLLRIVESTSLVFMQAYLAIYTLSSNVLDLMMFIFFNLLMVCSRNPAGNPSPS